MRTIIQRVSEASVTIDNTVHASIGPGLLVLLGIHVDDELKDLEFIVKKLLDLRIFDDADGRMNLSLKDVKGELLVISQFTLYADTKKGNRPSYIHAARPEKAVPLYEQFLESCADSLGKDVASGRFGADMKVALVNDGPVTITLDSR